MGNPCNPLKHGWKPQHTRILKLELEGKSVNAIALKVGRDRSYVQSLIDTEEYKEKFTERNRSVLIKVQKVFEESAVGAARTIKRIARKGTPDERVKLDAAKDIIDRIGYKPVQVIETRQRAYTPAEIESAKGTVKELEDTIIRLERKDSVFVLKRPKSDTPVKAQEEPVADVGQPTSEPSADRPQTVSA